MAYFTIQNNVATITDKTLLWRLLPDYGNPTNNHPYGFNQYPFTPYFEGDTIRFLVPGEAYQTFSSGVTILIDGIGKYTCNAVRVGGDMWIFDSPVYNDPTRSFLGRTINCTNGETLYDTYKFGRHEVAPLSNGTGAYKIINKGDDEMTNGIQQIDNVYFVRVGDKQWVKRFDTSNGQGKWAANANSYEDYRQDANNPLANVTGASLLSSPFADEQVVLNQQADLSGLQNGYIVVNNRQYAKVTGGYVCNDDVMKNLTPLPTGSGSNKIPVLAYHAIQDEDGDDYHLSFDKFRDDMQWLADNNWYTLTESEVIDALTKGTAIPANSVLVTLDDFYAGWYTGYNGRGAIGIMEDIGINAILFLTVRNMEDNPGSWDFVRVLDHNQFALGSHNNLHVGDGNLTSTQLHDQIVNSKSAIEAGGLTTVRSYAYPTGSRNDEARFELRKAGYDIAFNFGVDESAGSTESILDGTRLTVASTDGTLTRYNFNRKAVNPSNAYSLPSLLEND
ncbi:polysaccharide deacetylase [Agrilactobacillus composti DSM 18527 = JCM 14202]|uniref:polysaccharide deacetylase family protein n=3 Tax=Agrilactobacillus composti TaxID=398555 RepID=UPI00042E11DF|nr:polysaccharide deacetylase family protein [Agrilactobacillus composti]GAF41776.1 polysaccharide deacetylase [Agrilactobacillus composti DSM 18527 = JCM 14202]